jgi:endogenous inhibitor of DNA gyrase (YacG/DUF329 family)
MIDLGLWASEGYRVPDQEKKSGPEDPDSAEEKR